MGLEDDDDSDEDEDEDEEEDDEEVCVVKKLKNTGIVTESVKPCF